MTKIRRSLEELERRFRKKYNIEGVDLNKELELIRQKKSNLSKISRDAVPFLIGALQRHGEGKNDNPKI